MIPISWNLLMTSYITYSCNWFGVIYDRLINFIDGQMFLWIICKKASSGLKCFKILLMVILLRFGYVVLSSSNAFARLFVRGCCSETNIVF